MVTLASSRMAETQVATEEEKEKLISSEGKIGARAAAAAAWARRECATRRRRELEDRD